MLIVTPSDKGHYRSYIEILNSNSRNDVVHLFDLPFLIFMKTFLLILFSREPVIFLFGDRHVLWSIFCRLFSWDRQIKIIVYYSLQKKSVSLISNIKCLLFKVASLFRVDVYALEGGLAGVEGKYLDLVDPCLIDPVSSDNSSVQSLQRYLLAGYLDERKSVREICLAMNEAALLDDVQRALVLVGRQSESVSKFLESFQPMGFELEVYDNYVSDKELARHLSESMSVFCIYENHHGSSGMVLNAIAFRRRVLFQSVGVLAGLAEEISATCFLKRGESILSSILNVEALPDSSLNYDEAKAKAFLSKRTKSLFRLRLMGG